MPSGPWALWSGYWKLSIATKLKIATHLAPALLRDYPSRLLAAGIGIAKRQSVDNNVDSGSTAPVQARW